MSGNKFLTQEKLEYLADHLSEISEDGLELSDIDEDDELLMNFQDSLPTNDNGYDDLFDLENTPIVLLPSLEQFPNISEAEERQNVGKEILTTNNTASDKEENKKDSALTKNVSHSTNEEDKENQKPKLSQERNTRKRKANEIDKDNNKRKRTEDKIRKERIKEELGKLQWREGHLEMREDAIAFRATETLPTFFHDLVTPLDFFRHFFDDELIKMIVDQSNLFSMQTTPNSPTTLTELDVKRYVGICVLMSVIHLPSIRHYWSVKIGTEIIKDTMSLKQFEKIKLNLHFNDNTKLLPREDENHDRLHKIRPVVDYLVNRFQTVPYEACLSVDEQMCATKARNYMKQYMPAKPHKWGYKLFVLSGISGYSYNFEVYTGLENKQKDNEENLGASANVVVRLLRNLPSQMNHRVYFDNYYTTIPLLVQLAQRGIFSLGTVRRNRIPHCPFPSEKIMNKEKRGTSYEYVTEMDATALTSVIWKDNKAVSLLSTFAGSLPKHMVKRYDKKENKNVDIECPHLVKEYNRHMGGVDLLDSLIGRYKIKLKSRKWYIRLFYHILDIAVVNSWLLYKRVNAEKGNTKTMSLANFRTELGESLCLMGVRQMSQRGRKSDIEKQLEARRHSQGSVPSKDVRTDHLSHWPLWREKRNRCKFPNCKGFTYVFCEKCSVYLCFNKDKNCFRNFHV